MTTKKAKMVQVRRLAHSWYVQSQHAYPVMDTYWLLYLWLLSAERRLFWR